MVQNVNPTVQQPVSGKKAGVMSSLPQIATTAVTGAAMGGGIGGLMSLLPVSKTLVKDELFRTFTAESEGLLKSNKLADLLKRSEILPFKSKILDENQASEALDELLKKLPPKDELITLTKKAVKKVRASSLIKNGARMGIMAMLLWNLIQTIRNRKSE